MGFIDKIKLLFDLDKQISQKQHDINVFNQQLSDQQALYNNITKHARQQGEKEAQQIVEKAKNEVVELNKNISERITQLDALNGKITEVKENLHKLESEENKQKNKINRLADAYKSAAYSIEHFFNKEFSDFDYKSPDVFSDIDILVPTVELKLHSEDLKDLR